MSIAACEKVSHVLVAEVRHILLDPVTAVGNMPGERGERERGRDRVKREMATTYFTVRLLQTLS